MTEGKTPETPETIIEIIETINWYYLTLAVLIGAAVGMAALYYYSVMVEQRAARDA